MKKFRDLLRLQSPSISSFQILSDLHLEVGQQYSSFHIPVSAPNLILGGDIGRLIDYDGFLEFLERQVQSFEKVFLVLGNHEFYGISYEQGLNEAERLQREPSIAGKLHLLHRSRYDFPGGANTILLGCTLWSKISEDSSEIVKAKVKDFQKIQGWTVAAHQATFEEEIEWLRGQVESIRAERISTSPSRTKIIVVTHYAPSVQGTSRPEHEGNSWNSAFATDSIGREPWAAGVDVWLFGHTHFTTYFKIGMTRVVSNQRGYVLPGGALLAPLRGRDCKHEFDIRRTIRL